MRSLYPSATSEPTLSTAARRLCCGRCQSGENVVSFSCPPSRFPENPHIRAGRDNRVETLKCRNGIVRKFMELLSIVLSCCNKSVTATHNPPPSKHTPCVEKERSILIGRGGTFWGNGPITRIEKGRSEDGSSKRSGIFYVVLEYVFAVSLSFPPSSLPHFNNTGATKLKMFPEGSGIV